MKKKEEIRKGIKGIRREEAVHAGAYDGRFAHRVEKPKTAWKRKDKWKKDFQDED